MKPVVWSVAFVLLAGAVLTPGATAENHTETQGDLKNHAPMIIQIEDVPDSVMPLAGGKREVTFRFQAKDANGWQDIERGEVALYAPDNLTFIRHANVSGVSGGDGASQWFNATFEMWYYEMPSQEGYVLSIRVVDQRGAWSESMYADFEYQELAAIQVEITSDAQPTEGSAGGGEEETDDDLRFGSSEPGEESPTTEVVVANTGNVVLDLELYGTHLYHPDGHTIPVSAVRYGLDPTLEEESGLALEPSLLAIGIEPGAESSASVYWSLRVPTGSEQYVPAGSYSGSITITGVAAE